MSFAHLADGRNYVGVFTARPLDRFLATTGRTREPFERKSERLQGQRLAGLEGGQSFPCAFPSSLIVYLADAERLLPAEDRVVAAELTLDALRGTPMAEKGSLVS